MLASITFIGYYRNEKKIGVDMGAWMKDQIALLQQLEVQIRKGGGEKRIEKEHKKGKMTARERIDFLLDDGVPFDEIGLWAAWDM